VAVRTVLAREASVPLWVQTSGQMVALKSVDIRSQISSVITKVLVKEGQMVREGQLLFQLDSRQEQARLQQAQAQLSRSQVAYAEAQRQLQRARELLGRQFVSQAALDAAQAGHDAAQSALKADQAALQVARVNEGYTRIQAPFSGRAGAVAVYEGSTVNALNTTLLTLTQTDPVGLSFALPGVHLPALLKAQAEQAPVWVGQGALDGGDSWAADPATSKGLQARLVFVDSSVDAATGTVRAKAQMPQASPAWWPGSPVRVALQTGLIEQAVLVPHGAIVQSPRGRVVYVVQAQGVVQPVPVTVLANHGQERAVTGVKAGQTVVLDGGQNLRPGSKIREVAR
jgi:RND family efflux transporter MFP subunit